MGLFSLVCLIKVKNATFLSLEPQGTWPEVLIASHPPHVNATASFPAPGWWWPANNISNNARTHSAVSVGCLTLQPLAQICLSTLNECWFLIIYPLLPCCLTHIIHLGCFSAAFPTILGYFLFHLPHLCPHLVYLLHRWDNGMTDIIMSNSLLLSTYTQKEKLFKINR